LAKRFRMTNETGSENNMTCFLCKGNLIDKLTTFMVDIDTCIIIVKKVPSQVCSQCGETSYDNEVARKLETVVDSMRQSVMEIAVVDYLEKVA